MSKGFDHSAPISRIVPAAQIGHPKRGRIVLKVNGEEQQSADIGEMIWDVPHLVANLSTYVTLKPGDLIFTGTPAGVAAVVRGDRLEGEHRGRRQSRDDHRLMPEWSPQQDSALLAVSAWLKDKSGPQVFRLFGWAGTGKSTLARHLAQGVKSVKYAAFTGKAALVMRRHGAARAPRPSIR
jgi:hypothetical protein